MDGKRVTTHSTLEERAEFARRDAAFMESYRLRELARATQDPEERRSLLRQAEAQEAIAYAD